MKLQEKQIPLELFALFDLAALNSIVGKQNHSASYPCVWTNVSKSHLQSEFHKDKPHTCKNCQDVNIVKLSDYEHNLESGSGEQPMSKTGKIFGSVVAHNLLPLCDVFKYIPPIMHVIMGLTNDTLNELKAVVRKLDDNIENRTHFDGHHTMIKEKLLEMHDEVENLEAFQSNIMLADMVVQNDLKRIPLILAGSMKDAENVAKENYSSKRNSKEKPQCDAALCIIFDCDVINEWDEEIVCKNKCNIHTRCKGLAPIDDDEKIPEGYECQKCQTGAANTIWLQKSLEKHIATYYFSTMRQN